MTQHEALLPRVWRDTANVRKSTAWWIAAVLSGATLAVAAYYVAPGASVLFAIGGLVLGFFAPYVLALAWHGPGASVRQREAEWAEVVPVVRRTPRRTTPR